MLMDLLNTPPHANGSLEYTPWHSAPVGRKITLGLGALFLGPSWAKKTCLLERQPVWVQFGSSPETGPGRPANACLAMSPETTTIAQNATRLIQPSAASALALWGMYMSMIPPVQHTASSSYPTSSEWVSKSVEALAILHQNFPTSLGIKTYVQRMHQVLNTIIQ